MLRNRIIYFFIILILIISGILSRQISSPFSDWSGKYPGDVIWTMIVFFITGFILKNKSSFSIAVISLLVSFIIEFSQLYHALWIDKIRSFQLGGWILGIGFHWQDLICYLAGILLCVLIEKIFKKYLFISYENSNCSL